MPTDEPTAQPTRNGSLPGDNTRKMSGAQLGGIIGGCVGGLCCLGIIAFIYKRSKRARKSEGSLDADLDETNYAHLNS